MSMSHIIVVAVIALIVLGPEKLPQVARMAGKFMAEFRRRLQSYRAALSPVKRQFWSGKTGS